MIEAIKESYRALFSWRTLGILGLCIVIGAAAGPFGTLESRSFSSRLLFWALVCGGVALIGNGGHEIARQVFPRHRPILRDLFTVALLTAIVSPLIWVLCYKILPPEDGEAPGFARLVYYTAIVSAAICIARRILPGFEPIGYFGTEETQPEQPRLFRRLPPTFHGPILRLTVRDHFVDVVSAAGVETIRLRFADAIAEMDPVIGHCTHRSHWVAQGAILGSERENGKIFLRLSNGDLVPVSRKYRSDLEEEGLI